MYGLMEEAPRGGAGIEIFCLDQGAGSPSEAPRGGAGIEISKFAIFYFLLLKPLVEGLVLKSGNRRKQRKTSPKPLVEGLVLKWRTRTSPAGPR